MELIDAGLLFNSPYPPLLRKERSVDVLLSFDFSARESDEERPFKVIIYSPEFSTVLTCCKLIPFYLFIDLFVYLFIYLFMLSAKWECYSFPHRISNQRKTGPGETVFFSRQLTRTNSLKEKAGKSATCSNIQPTQSVPQCFTLFSSTRLTGTSFVQVRILDPNLIFPFFRPILNDVYDIEKGEFSFRTGHQRGDLGSYNSSKFLDSQTPLKTKRSKTGFPPSPSTRSQ